jgi:hypothetical protein
LKLRLRGLVLFNLTLGYSGNLLTGGVQVDMNQIPCYAIRAQEKMDEETMHVQDEKMD